MFEIGSSLGEARLRQGIELAKVEAATRIRGRYLDALEHDQFDALPEGPYRRSFLFEYAEFLGLDGDVYVAEYDRRFRAPELQSPAPPPRPVVLATRRRAAVLAVIAAVVLVAGLAVWLSASGTKRSPRAATPAGSTRARTHTRPAQPPPVTTQVPRPRSPSLVVRAARGSCWLVVRIGGAGGRVVYEGTLAPGQTVRFGLRRPLWIRLGAPWNVEATIARRSLTGELPARTGDVVATPQGLQPATP